MEEEEARASHSCGGNGVAGDDVEGMEEEAAVASCSGDRAEGPGAVRSRASALAGIERQKRKTIFPEEKLSFQRKNCFSKATCIPQDVSQEWQRNLAARAAFAHVGSVGFCPIADGRHCVCAAPGSQTVTTMAIVSVTHNATSRLYSCGIERYCALPSSPTLVP
eukprot:198457-Rhodomonas_salina.1